LLLASLLGETASRARSAFNHPAKAKTVTVAKRQRGDAGAVFDLAPNYRLGVGPVSSKWWGDGVRKKGEDKQPDVLTHYLILPGVCGKLPRTGRQVFSRQWKLFAVSGQSWASASLPGFKASSCKGELKGGSHAREGKSFAAAFSFLVDIIGPAWLISRII
jgi:hypothetical protein